jgi:hypothetical protein
MDRRELPTGAALPGVMAVTASRNAVERAGRGARRAGASPGPATCDAVGV